MKPNSKWPMVHLSEVCEINPRRPASLLKLPDEYPVTFVPMPAVEQFGGTISSPETRPFGEVRKGFTYFGEGDVIFAKITPCMQNGKSAIARGLVNQLGFGSTEFHVIRPNPDCVLAEWVWHFVRQGPYRQEATHHFQGAVGQQRVPSSYLESTSIPLPSIPEQHRIVGRIKECMERVEEIELLRDEALAEQAALFPSVLNKTFNEVAGNAPTKTIEEICLIRGGGSLPKGSGKDCGKNSVLLVKVGDMNLPDNERLINTAREFLPAPSAGNSVVQAGAVIFPKRGGAIATNKKRVLGRPSLIDPNLMAIEARQELVSPGYLYYWSLTLDLRTISNGGVIPQLNRKDLAPLVIPVPDLATQKELVEKFEMLESLCSQLRAEAKVRDSDCAHLRDAILRKAFAGEL